MESLKGLELYQRINHFPGMFNIYRKNYLAKNLEKMRKHFPDQYSFYPKTWLLPTDHAEVLAHLRVAQHKKLEETLIAKPWDQCQGKGIFLVTAPAEVPVSQKLVVQHYINK